MDDVLKLLGLIYRAKEMYLGEDILNHLDDVHFIFMASDASDKSKERYLKKIDYYKIAYTDLYDSTSLAEALGKRNVKFIGIKSKGFTKSIQNKLKM